MSVFARRRLCPFVVTLGIVLVAVPTAQAKTSGGDCSTSTGGLLGTTSLGEQVPIELSTPLEVPLLASFGVLRRAALPSDQIPALSPIGGELEGQIASYYPAYVRELKVLPSGVRYYLIPGFPVATTVPPAKCLPPSQRGNRPRLVEHAQQRAAKLVYCVAQLGSKKGKDSCTSFSEAGQAHAIFEDGALLEEAVELVPDGVSSVRFDYTRGRMSVETVNENAFLFTPPHSVVREAEATFRRLLKHAPHPRHQTKAQVLAGLELLLKELATVKASSAPSKLEWLDVSGAPIRTILPPQRHDALSNL